LTFITRHRIAITSAIALALIAATALRRGPSDPDLRNLSQFWSGKMAWRGAADCVIAGDSRAGQGLVPAVLRERLGDARVLNFAFDSGGYSEEYLGAIDRVLDADSPAPTILLALTPYSLTPGAIRLNEFEHQRHLASSPLKSALGDSLDRLQPMRVDRVMTELSGRRTNGPAKDRLWHDDGWVQVLRDGGNERMYVDHYHESFQDNHVDADIVRNVARHVARWRGRGIRVAAFRPPVAAPIRAIEDTCSQFDETAIRAILTDAGAQWLDVAGSPYATYDGSHLGSREAMRLSTEVGRLMADTFVVRHGTREVAQNSRVDAATIAD